MPRRAAAEQVRGAAGRGHRHRELPGLRAPHGLDDEVGAAARQLAHARDVGRVALGQTVAAAPKRSAAASRSRVRVEHDRPGARRRRERAEHQPERAGAEDRRRVSSRSAPHRARAPRRPAARRAAPAGATARPAAGGRSSARRARARAGALRSRRAGRAGPRTGSRGRAGSCRQRPHGAESAQNTSSPTRERRRRGRPSSTTPANSCPSRDG